MEKKIHSSYVLQKKVGDEVIYFKEWASPQSKNPIFSNKIRFARHWRLRANCQRFWYRNSGALKGFEVERIIPARQCYFCGVELPKSMNKQAKFCSDECRNKSHYEK